MTVASLPVDPVLHCELTDNYGITIELLHDVFGRSNDETVSGWSLHRVPNVGFYRMLHPFLKKWSTTQSSTKTSIGKFYLAIDKQLQERGSSPYNTYRFIERFVSSDIPDTAFVPYGFDKRVGSLQAELGGCYERVQDLGAKVNEQQAEMDQLKLEFEKTKEVLTHTKDALRNVTNEKSHLQKDRICIQKKLHKANDMYESTLSDLFHVEDDLLESNSELSEVVTSLQKETSTHGGAVSFSSDFDENGQLVNFSFLTKCGGKFYSESIRQLYYSLLADQVPPAKIARTIKSVLKCFLPALNVDKLVLPRERCAGYMRREELKTLSMAHKAHTVVESKSIDLNSDGTTKCQKKIAGVTVNGMVWSLNEVPDGTADSMIEDISRELEKLRDIAHALNLPNPERINWTLFASSTSDSAATQKRFNRLVEQCREKDGERFGPVSSDAIELVENLCAMHLGSNLRKAFLDGTKAITAKNSEASVELSAQHMHREHDRTDTFIHEFCKLFGMNGVPEYGCGIRFADFLALKLGEVCPPEVSKYYHSCIGVQLERQVGSRYFVSAANATKISFLAEAAIEFLKYTGKDEGNNLEKTLYRKLHDAEELARLKADAIMFYFVYAELVMLAKSEKLKKSALDMNKHYLELQLFLQMIEDDPEAAMDKNHRVFVSEERLYGNDKSVNHRIRSKNMLIHTRLFQPDEWESSLLNPLLVAGATAMKNKLSNYAKNQLPGGKYWEPEPAVEAVLKALKPNNDICESILGLNDYLTTAIPNMHQMTRSNLVEVKKNGTMKWYQDLPQEEKSAVTELAMKRRKDVMKQYCEEEKARSKQKQEYMKRCHQKRKALREKAAKEKDQLSQQHLITTNAELREALEEIDAEEATSSSKKNKKLALIRMQINIRKKVLNQKITIPFSHHGKKRPLVNIIKELTDFIAANSPQPVPLPQPDFNPFSLVGKEILHKFSLDSGEDRWFNGVVISYNAAANTHELAYDGETEHQHFNLTEDILDGDIKIIDV